MRQRDAILADRETARRLFLELNPNEPLPELSGGDQPVLTESSTSSSAIFQTGESPAPGSSRSPDKSVIRPSLSPFPQLATPLSTGVKRSVNHLDPVDEPPSKKQTIGVEAPVTNSDGTTQVSTVSASASTGLKWSAQDEDGIAPPTKRYKHSFDSSGFGAAQFLAEKQPASPVPDQAEFGPVTYNEHIFSSWGIRSSPTPAEVPRSDRPVVSAHESASRSHLSRRANGTNNRTTSTTNSEDHEPQKLPASRQPVALRQQPITEQVQSSEVECVACCKEVLSSEAHSNSCSHVYCSKCINKLFRKAVRDESLWPPQCCKAEMPIKEIEHLLGKKLLPLVKARQVEMSVTIPDRTYCRQCSAFIPQAQIHGTDAICPECWTSTCTECKETFHVGDCENGLQQDVEDLEALAEKEGWKKCSTCTMIVEHNTGCNHMT